MNLRPLITGTYWLLIVGLGLFSSAYFWRNLGIYNEYKREQAVNRQAIQGLERRLAEQKASLQRLQQDPGYVEKAARQQLGYVRPGEQVYFFAD